MKYAVFKDFSGGLNTSLDPTLIRLNQSPSLANVDFADTGGFTRRKGYYPILDTPYSTPVKGALRYYQLDGDIYWCFATATQIRVEGSAPPNGIADALAIKTSGTTTQVVVDGAYAGANTYAYSVISASGQISSAGSGATFAMNTPVCTDFTIDSLRSQSASVRIDGGVWGSQSASTYQAASLSGGSHAIEMKAPYTTKRMSGCAASIDLPSGWKNLTIFAVCGWAVGTTLLYSDALLKTGRGWARFNGYGATQLEMTDFSADTSTLTQPYGLFRLDFAVQPDGTLRVMGANRFVPPSSSFGVGVTAMSAYFGENPCLYMDNSAVSGVTKLGLKPRTSDPLGIVRVLVDGVLLTDCTSSFGWSVSGTPQFGEAYSSGYSWTTSSNTYYYKLATVAADKVVHTYSATSGPTLSTLAATDDRVSLVQLNDKVFYGSASRAIRQFDGSADSTVTSAPTALHMVEHKRRLFAVPGTDPAIVNYTVLDQPASWTGTGSGFFRLMGKDSGAECTGMVSWNDNLYYTSQSQLWYVNTNSTPSNWSAKLISKVHGCVAPRSLAAGNNGIVFLSADGVRSYGQFPGILSDDGSSVMRISEDITPTLDSVTNKSIAAGIVYNNRYWLSAALNGATYNNAILVADLGNITTDRQPAWTLYTGISIAGFYVTRGDEYALYGWHPTNGEVYRLDYGDTDNGSAIATSYTLPPIAPTDYAGVVHFRYAHVSADADAPTALTVTPATDDVACAPVTLTVNEDSDRRPVRTPLNARGRSLSLTMSTDGTGQPITVSRVVIPYIPSAIR